MLCLAQSASCSVIAEHCHQAVSGVCGSLVVRIVTLPLPTTCLCASLHQHCEQLVYNVDAVIHLGMLWTEAQTALDRLQAALPS